MQLTYKNIMDDVHPVEQNKDYENMKKQIIAGVFAGALSVGGAAAQENSTNHLEAAKGNGAATSEQEVSRSSEFARMVMEQISSQSSQYTLDKQTANIQDFCDAFNTEVVQPLKKIRNDIDVSAEYKTVFLKGESRVSFINPQAYTNHACIIYVNGQEIDRYDVRDILRSSIVSRTGNADDVADHVRQSIASDYATAILEALSDIQVRHIARSHAIEEAKKAANAPSVLGI